MIEQTTRTWFTNRQFVAAIRAALDDGGHADVQISRQWIDEDTPGYVYLVRVPVGPALTVPLKVMDSFFRVADEKDLRRQAEEFAKALVNLKRAERMLKKYARDVSAAAAAVIDAARADGLDVRLEGVGFTPTYASHLTGKSWRDAAHHILAAVSLAHTSFYLRPDVTTLWVEEPEDVAAELADILEEQRERQDRIAELDRLGADLIVDQLTLDLLAAHGLDPVELLTRVWKEQCVNLKVQHDGQEVSMSLAGSDGRATASITLPDANWNGEYLWFRGDEQSKDHRDLVGKSLGDLVRHPAFASRPIVDVFSRHSDHIVFDLSDKVMFDADTGRLWREEALAA